MSSDRPPETVRAYLAELQRALKGAPAGLISDALADCEEHLNNEIAQNPNTPEKVVLASVIETYGTPQEIAEEYRDMEATIAGPFPKQEEPSQKKRRAASSASSATRAPTAPSSTCCCRLRPASSISYGRSSASRCR
jgi:uncharacterized membrane protein